MSSYNHDLGFSMMCHIKISANTFFARVSGAHANSTGQIINLLWVDLLANALVSTKSPLSRSGGEAPLQSVSRPAQRYVNRLRYDWRYAAAALAFALLYLVMFLWSAALLLTRSLTLNKLRSLLNQSAAGRAMTTERYQAESEVDFASTKQWVKTRGGEPLRVTSKDSRKDDACSGSYALLQTKTDAQVSVSPQTGPEP